ncbi:MAG: hypothetical protein HY619_05100 [Thaumarchaeota archaeon]|nr:hypothetical protein [Nitrososphaerota archaeon]
MQSNSSSPVMLYDDYCALCTQLAKASAKWSKSWIRILGHSTSEAEKIKSKFFAETDHPEEFFWLIRGNTGYGGRSGVIPLLTEILRGRLVR